MIIHQPGRRVRRHSSTFSHLGVILRVHARRSAVIASVLGLALFGALLSTLLTARPGITDGSLLRQQTNTATTVEFPAAFDSGGNSERVDVSLTLTVGWMSPMRYTVSADDCVQELMVNNAPVKDPAIPFCDYASSRTIDLSHYLRPGANQVYAVVQNNGGAGSFNITPAWTGLPLRVLSLTLIALPFALAYFLLWLRRPSPQQYVTSGIIGLGLLLRVAYLLTTPYNVRGHDTDGHIEYIHYLATNWHLPPATAGWEYWQPPLYYFLTSLLQRFGEMLGWSKLAVIGSFQWFAFALSAATLVLCLWCAKLLFPNRTDESVRHRHLFLLGAAVFPSLVFNASRINNDVLAIVLSFLTVALLLQWRRHHTLLPLYGAFAATALHILTKSTGYLFLPILLGSMVLSRGFSWKKTFAHSLGGIGLTFLFVLGLFIARPPSSSLVGNIGTLNSALKLQNEVANYVTFNPAKVVTVPYNNPFDDASRRQYFLEYLFKSAFFGEFQFDVKRRLAAQWLLSAGLFLLALMARGMWRSRRTILQDAPMWLLFFGLLFGHMVFRSKYPYGSSQDFRYTLPLILPWLLFAVRGTDAGKWVGTILRSGYLLFCTFCVLFLISLWAGQ